MDNPLDMTKETLERLEAEAAGPEYHHRQEVHKGFGGRSEKEKTESDPSRVAFVVAAQEERRVPERRLSMENENRREMDKIEDEQSRTAVLVTVQDEERAPKRRLSVEYEMMPPPPSPATCHLPPPASPAMRPRSATPRREFSQPRSEIIEIHFFFVDFFIYKLNHKLIYKLIYLHFRSPAVNSPYWASGASPRLAALGLEGLEGLLKR